LASVDHLTLAERGAYTDLVFFQWENGRLPKEPERLARLIGCTPDEFAGIWPQISEKFAENDTGLVNKRLEEHRDESVRLRDSRVRAATETNAQRRAHRGAERGADRGGDRDAQREDNTPSASVSGTLTDTVTGTSPSPSPSPSPKPAAREEPRKRGSRLPADFEPDLEYARKELPDIDAGAEADRFKDYWKARSGPDAVKVDWKATWRNWIRTCRDSGKYARKPNQASSGREAPVFR
jgi:uncharacterized protein YdaU (DUF1376 family)